MEIDTHQLHKRIKDLSDDELLQMLFDNPDQYRSDALVLAREEAAKRNLSLNRPPTSKIETAKPDKAQLLKAADAVVRAAVEAMGPGSYLAAGEKIICPVCRHDQFQSESILLNTRGLTFFRLDWLNSSATTLVCTNCSLIQWFKKTPERS